jgi:hypothetical protein
MKKAQVASRYKGQALDIALAEYGLHRDHRDDWQFRKDSFMEIHRYDPERALEILLGVKTEFMRDHHKALVCEGRACQSVEELKKFLGRLTKDPFLRRNVTLRPA